MTQPACGEAVAEVEVLHVHPVALVEVADPLERRAADQHEGAVDRVDGSRLDLRRAIGGERPEAPARRPMPVKWPRALSGVGNERREAWSKLPSSSSRRGPDDPDLGPGVHQLEQRVERARA